MLAYVEFDRRISNRLRGLSNSPDFDEKILAILRILEINADERTYFFRMVSFDLIKNRQRIQHRIQYHKGISETFRADSCKDSHL